MALWTTFQTFALIVAAGQAFLVPSFVSQRKSSISPAPRPARHDIVPLFASPSSTDATYEPIFDFSQNYTVDSFERLDDAIMGGISTSTLRIVPGEPYASWSGVCRIDGGGFCGMRTLPFKEPLMVGNDTSGFYIDCKLASDDEPERRVWKMTTRSERTRGEELYQAAFQLDNGWTRVKVPFGDFRLVRGPRLVEGGSPLNATGGLYQIGLSLSKFEISRNMTEIDNFRPGYFELQVKEIGAYSTGSTDSLQVDAPDTMSKDESKRNRPLIVKLLLPVAKLFFSEQSQRRRSAMKILREQRGLSRPQAMLFGIRKKAQIYGMARSLLSTAGIVLVDSFRTVARSVLRYGVFFPIVLATRIAKFPAKMLSKLKGKSEETNNVN